MENPEEFRSNTAPVGSTPDSTAGAGSFPSCQQFSVDLAQNLPGSFDFTSQASLNLSSMSSTSDEYHTPEGGSPLPRGEDDKSMFVFSGSSPLLQHRRRNAAEALTPPPILLPSDATPRVESDEAVAMLTQQLELTSDDVS